MTAATVAGRRSPLPPLALPGVVFCAGVLAMAAMAVGRSPAVDLDVVRLGAWLVWPLAGAVLLDARPRHLLGHVLTLPGLLPPALLLAGIWASGTSPDVVRATAETPHLLVPLLVVLLVGVPLTFPSGLPDDQLGRILAGCAAAVTGWTLLVTGMRAWAPGSAGPPTALDEVLAALERVGIVLLVPGVVAVVIREVLLVRAAAGLERNRHDWFILGAVLLMVGTTATAALDDALAAYVSAALTTLAPAALVLLVLARTVPPVDRALLRAGLLLLAAAVLSGVWALSLLLLQRTDLPDRSAAAAVVTAVVALVLAPVHARIRDRALVAVIGHGHHPAPVVAALGRSLGIGDDAADGVDAALRAVAAAVRSPQALLLPADGDPAPPDAAEVPLRAGGQDLGRLVVLPRRAGEQWGWRERELLAALATPVAQLLRAQQLAQDLELARGDAVAQRLDERRRLRRDLHDSVGPLLAGLGLQADALRRAARPEDAAQLTRVTDAVRACRAEVRRLVDDLEAESVALDDLAGAVRELVDGWSSATVERGLVLRLEAPSDLPDLPGDIRVAAYRVVAEALTNVVQHASASTCTVRLHVDAGQLLVEVRDDGTGLVTGSGRRGVGLRSMDERTRTLRGSLQVADGERGGTIVRARLPLTQVAPVPEQVAP